MKNIFRCLLVVLALVVMAAPTMANHAWGNYHWARTSNPFTLKLGDNVSSTWDSYLSTTSSDWSQSNVLDTVIVAGGAKGNCRPTSGRVEVCAKAYGNNGWLGLAQIWASGSHITQGAVKMNDTYFALSQYNNPVERNHVMCQEVGHTLGLGHTSEDGSSQGTCMDYSQSTSSQHPNSHDYNMLSTIYSHLDSTTTVKAAPAAMNQIDFENRAQWGKMIDRSSDGRAALYMLDFGGGHKIFTFVYYTQEKARDLQLGFGDIQN